MADRRWPKRFRAVHSLFDALTKPSANENSFDLQFLQVSQQVLVVKSRRSLIMNQIVLVFVVSSTHSLCMKRIISFVFLSVDYVGIQLTSTCWRQVHYSNFDSVVPFRNSRYCVIVGRPKFCSLPPIDKPNHPCKGFFRKWTFNATEETCRFYIYGGCHGTKNLFDSRKQCQSTCKSSVTSKPVLTTKLG